MPSRDQIEDFFKKFKIPAALSFIGIILIIGGLLTSNKPQKIQSSNFPKESIVSGKQILVDVSGAVSRPGVYQLKMDSRVEDAILAAGGLSERANGEYVSKYLNMAQKVSDGAKIYVPMVGDNTLPLVQAVAGSSSQVNINSASQTELEALPGIGPVTASKIISGRPYSKSEDLLNQKIVSKATWEKIKDSIIY